MSNDWLSKGAFRHTHVCCACGNETAPLMYCLNRTSCQKQKPAQKTRRYQKRQQLRYYYQHRRTVHMQLFLLSHQRSRPCTWCEYVTHNLAHASVWHFLKCRRGQSRYGNLDRSALEDHRKASRLAKYHRAISGKAWEVYGLSDGGFTQTNEKDEVHDPQNTWTKQSSIERKRTIAVQENHLC